MCGSVGTNGVTFNFCGSYDNTLAETSTAGFVGASAGKVTLDRCYTADRDKFSDGVQIMRFCALMSSFTVMLFASSALILLSVLFT